MTASEWAAKKREDEREAVRMKREKQMEHKLDSMEVQGLITRIKQTDIEDTARVDSVKKMTEAVVMEDDGSFRLHHLRDCSPASEMGIFMREILEQLRQNLSMDMAAVCIVEAKEVEVVASSGEGAPAVASRTKNRHDMCGFTILQATPSRSSWPMRTRTPASTPTLGFKVTFDVALKIAPSLWETSPVCH